MTFKSFASKTIALRRTRVFQIFRLLSSILSPHWNRSMLKWFTTWKKIFFRISKKTGKSRRHTWITMYHNYRLVTFSVRFSTSKLEWNLPWRMSTRPKSVSIMIVSLPTMKKKRKRKSFWHDTADVTNSTTNSSRSTPPTGQHSESFVITFVYSRFGESNSREFGTTTSLSLLPVYANCSYLCLLH